MLKIDCPINSVVYVRNRLEYLLFVNTVKNYGMDTQWLNIGEDIEYPVTFSMTDLKMYSYREPVAMTDEETFVDKITVEMVIRVEDPSDNNIQPLEFDDEYEFDVRASISIFTAYLALEFTIKEVANLLKISTIPVMKLLNSYNMMDVEGEDNNISKKPTFDNSTKVVEFEIDTEKPVRRSFKEHEELLIKMYNEGASLSKISNAIGRPKHQISSKLTHLCKRGKLVKRTKTPEFEWGRFEIEKVLDLEKKGLIISAIAMELDTTEISVKNQLKYLHKYGNRFEIIDLYISGKTPKEISKITCVIEPFVMECIYKYADLINTTAAKELYTEKSVDVELKVGMTIPSLASRDFNIVALDPTGTIVAIEPTVQKCLDVLRKLTDDLFDKSTVYKRLREGSLEPLKGYVFGTHSDIVKKFLEETTKE